MALRFRKHIRRPENDYAEGAYFVTLCAHNRIQVFGRINGMGPNARVDLSDIGHIADYCWRSIPNHLPHVHLHEMQIMPDHLHAILVLHRVRGNGTGEATKWVATTDAVAGPGKPANGPARGSLGAIIGAYDSETTKRMNRLNGTMGQRLWQPNFHERAIRERGGEFERIAKYIAENPMKWR